MEINEYFPSPESVNARMYVDSIESPDGMWVKWEDVQEVIERLEYMIDQHRHCNLCENDKKNDEVINKK